MDASALVKLYHTETGIPVMRELFWHPEHKNAFFATDLVTLEVLVRLAKRARRGGRKERREIHRAIVTYARHRNQNLNVVGLDSEMLREAEIIATAYSSSGAGTLDLLHAASARQVQRLTPEQPLVFVAADRKLRSLVERLGFRTFDPESGDPGLL